MTLTRVFQSGNSQAVCLPKEFRFDVQEVEILRLGGDVILRVPRRSGAEVFDALAALQVDSMAEGREDALAQERDGP